MDWRSEITACFLYPKLFFLLVIILSRQITVNFGFTNKQHYVCVFVNKCVCLGAQGYDHESPGNMFDLKDIVLCIFEGNVIEWDINPCYIILHFKIYLVHVKYIVCRVLFIHLFFLEKIISWEKEF